MVSTLYFRGSQSTRSRWFVHRKTAIAGDQSSASFAARSCFQISHIVVFVTKALRFAEPDTSMMLAD
jgi:hypothetical protein